MDLSKKQLSLICYALYLDFNSYKYKYNLNHLCYLFFISCLILCTETDNKTYNLIEVQCI